MGKKTRTSPECPYCGGKASLRSSKLVYGGRDYGQLWVCENYPGCDSYVGCHSKTGEPLGTLANRELRKWRHNAHYVFDPFWQNGLIDRKDLYARLAKALGIPVEKCHIGMFDVDTCKRVVELCLRRKETKKEVNRKTSDSEKDYYIWKRRSNSVIFHAYKEGSSATACGAPSDCFRKVEEKDDVLTTSRRCKNCVKILKIT